MTSVSADDTVWDEATCTTKKGKWIYGVCLDPGKSINGLPVTQAQVAWTKDKCWMNMNPNQYLDVKPPAQKMKNETLFNYQQMPRAQDPALL